MKMFSLRSLIDDIMLLLRNNNISESEDFSRAQIAHWILSYKALLLKQKRDQERNNGEDEDDKSMYKTIGPLELEDVKGLDGSCLFTKRTKEDIPELIADDPYNIIAVFDQEGCPIQYMNSKRRHFQYYRKYTFGELSWSFTNNRVYIQGLVDQNELKYIWLTGIFVDTDEEDEDGINIPGWMVPQIKQMIMANELNFLIRTPSDEENNSTLEDIKPQSLELKGWKA